MQSFWRLLKTLPFMLIGLLMITASRRDAAEYGLMLIVGSIAYLWLTNYLGDKKSPAGKRSSGPS